MHRAVFAAALAFTAFASQPAAAQGLTLVRVGTTFCGGQIVATQVSYTPAVNPPTNMPGPWSDLHVVLLNRGGPIVSSVASVANQTSVIVELAAGQSLSFTAPNQIGSNVSWAQISVACVPLVR
jgi:hypothetical protein